MSNNSYSHLSPKSILIWLVLSLPVMALFVPAHARPLLAQADFSAVDAYVEAQRESLNIPGMAVAIVKGDQVAYLGSYGQAGSDRPVTPQNSFMIGSTTKSFTALAIMQLVEAGKVELDAPVQTYIPWFRVADESASALITVKHLLTQTSGLSNSAGLQDLTASDLSDQALENSVRTLKDVALVRAPGTMHEYSNVNFTILGLIVQVVSGQSYESYMQAHILDPLEMLHSFTSQDEAIKDGMSAGYNTLFGIPYTKDVPFNRGNLPGGFLICSAEDLAHYLIAQMNDGRFGETSVISPQGMAAMHQPLVNADTPDGFYGMGWYISPINGVPTVSHGGENVNFSAFLLMEPEEELGIAVLSNANGTFVAKATEQIGAGVLAILMGEQPKPYEKPLAFYMTFGSASIPAVISLLWIGWMVFRFMRRQKRPAPARRGTSWWVWLIGVPVFVDLNLLIMLLVFIPGKWGLPLDGMASMFPDCFMLIIGSALLVAGWGVLRTIMTLRKSSTMHL